MNTPPELELIRLNPIPEDKRLVESKPWAKFDAARQRILGAVRDRVTGGLRELPNVKLVRLPRLADFAQFAVAAEIGASEVEAREGPKQNIVARIPDCVSRQTGYPVGSKFVVGTTVCATRVTAEPVNFFRSAVIRGANNIMRRLGSTKLVVLICVGTGVVLVAMAAATWYANVIFIDRAAERSRQESTQKLREQESEIIKQAIANLGKGGVVISGRRWLPDGTLESPTVFGNQSDEKICTVSISWAVSQTDFAKLANEMSLEDVRAILDLSALRYIPNGPDSKLTLVCSQMNRKVTLGFSGYPEVKLTNKSIEGSD